MEVWIAILCGFGLVMTAAVAPAAADETPRPGTPGTVTAFFPEPGTVLRVEACPCPPGKPCSYAACVVELRTKAHADVCRMQKKGTHSYWLQIGEQPRKLLHRATCGR